MENIDASEAESVCSTVEDKWTYLHLHSKQEIFKKCKKLFRWFIKKIKGEITGVGASVNVSPKNSEEWCAGPAMCGHVF